MVEGHAAGRDGRRPDPSGNQGPPHCLAGSNSLQTQGPGLAVALGRPTGRVPETLRTASAGAAAGVSMAGPSWTVLITNQGKGEVAQSAKVKSLSVGRAGPYWTII